MFRPQRHTVVRLATAFPAPLGRAALLPDKWVGESKQHGDTDTDQEGRVDQAGEQEHLGLQSVHELRLACRSFEVFTTHDCNTDAAAESAQADDETRSQCYESDVSHDNSLV